MPTDYDTAPYSITPAMPASCRCADVAFRDARSGLSASITGHIAFDAFSHIFAAITTDAAAYASRELRHALFRRAITLRHAASDAD